MGCGKVYVFEITRFFPLSHKKQRKSIARVARRVKCVFFFGMPLEWNGSIWIGIEIRSSGIELACVCPLTHSETHTASYTRSNTQINRGAERHYSHGTLTPMQASAPLWSSHSHRHTCVFPFLIVCTPHVSPSPGM